MKIFTQQTVYLRILTFTGTVGLLLLPAINCASNAIVKLPKNYEHKMAPGNIQVKSDASVNKTIVAIASEEMKGSSKSDKTADSKDKPLSAERVQQIFLERAQKSLKFKGENKVDLELLIVSVHLPVMGRLSGLSDNGDAATMEVFLTMYDPQNHALIGKYSYQARYSSQVGRSQGFGVADSAFAIANAASAATKSDEDYIVYMVEDIINKILKQHGPD